LIGLAIVMSWWLLTSRMAPALLPMTLRDETILLVVFDGALAVAVTLSVVVAWRYWGWLFKEHGR
jgi:hypothetical protein